MKRIVLSAVLLFAILCFLSAGSVETLSFETKIITAYKNEMSGLVPEPILSLRLLDEKSLEFFSNDTVSLPIEARNNDYPAFYWIIAGNVFGNLTVEFTVSPMWLDDTPETAYIPFSLEFDHQISRVGNAVIVVNGDPASLPVSFLQYDFSYADAVSFPSGSTLSVAGTPGSRTVLYNMSQNTTVQEEGQSVVYVLNVCNNWNRIGLATMHLEIDEDGKTLPPGGVQLPDGLYFSTVRVEVTPGS